ncbi:hypothetical protein BH09DEP1_BH09DEP1_0440 [soil metagenome]
MAQIRMNPAFSALMVQILAKVTSFAKFSFIIGSKMAFFAPAAMLLPLAGAFGGIAGSLGMLGMGLAIRCVFFGAMPLAFFAFHIPGFFASLYWASTSKLIRIAPALVCALLFMVHPIGAANLWYSLFWIVPVVAALLPSRLFTTALGSSFTAHAVGTLVWLYAGQLSSADFAVLAPVVIVERLMMAVGMVLAYKVIAHVYSTLRQAQGERGKISFCALTTK